LPVTDIVLPSLTNDLTDKALPISAESPALRVELILVVPVTDSDEPKRTKLRTDIELPRLT